LDIRDIAQRQALSYSHEYYNGMIEKLLRYHSSEHGVPIPPQSEPRHIVPLRHAYGIIALAVVISIAALAFTIGADLIGSAKVEFATAKWERVQEIPTARASTMATSMGTTLYVVGGLDTAGPIASLESLNLGMEPVRWIVDAQLPKVDSGDAGRYLASFVTVGDQLYLIGGWQQKPALPTGSVWQYNPQTNRWTARAPMKSDRMSACSVAGVIDSKIFLVTGCNGYGGTLSVLDIYDPTTNTWTTGDAAPHQHQGGGGGVIEGKLYVVGGLQYAKDPSSNLDVYDPINHRWATARPMPKSLHSFASGVIDGKLVVAGGTGVDGPSADVFVYDPDRNTWTNGPRLPAPQFNCASAVINDQLFVVSGRHVDNVPATHDVYVLRSPR
jgi:N-acetylneuraminic acid mutarotase